MVTVLSQQQQESETEEQEEQCSGDGCLGAKPDVQVRPPDENPRSVSSVNSGTEQSKKTPKPDKNDGLDPEVNKPNGQKMRLLNSNLMNNYILLSS